MWSYAPLISINIYNVKVVTIVVFLKKGCYKESIFEEKGFFETFGKNHSRITHFAV